MRLVEPLAMALDGTGPAIAPMPTISPTMSADYVGHLIAAVRPDDRHCPLESADIALVVATSGSTGAPRGVLLSASNLTPGTRAANGATPADVRWVQALPAYSMGGLNVVVRALATGREPVCVDSVGGAGPFTASGFASAVREATSTSADVRTSLVPPQLARLMGSDAGIEALRACTLVLVGGAAARPSLLDAAARLGIAVTTTYGATETAGGCVFDGRPIDGASVRLDNGQVAVCGPMVAHGYRDDPVATRRHFVDGCYVSQDHGELADGVLRILGRIDDIAIINGINVSPDAVSHLVADLPDVASAAVIVMRDDDAEPWLACYVEPRDGALDVAEAVRLAVQEHLGKAAVPARIVTVTRLPHLPSGKVDRRLLEQWARGNSTGDS